MSAKSELLVKAGECSILIAHSFIELRQDDHYIRLSWQQFKKLAEAIRAASFAHSHLFQVNVAENE
jgi:hypothetical protein